MIALELALLPFLAALTVVAWVAPAIPFIGRHPAAVFGVSVLIILALHGT